MKAPAAKPTMAPVPGSADAWKKAPAGVIKKHLDGLPEGERAMVLMKASMAVPTLTARFTGRSED